MKDYKFIKELINIKSFSLEKNKEIIDYLIKQFKDKCEEIIKIKNTTNNKENLLIGLNTKLRNIDNAIILSGHIDTVVADEKNYITNPYIATEKDGKIYGLGSIDMKSFFACILDNIDTLKSFKLPIIISITSDEETYLNGVEQITKTLKERNIYPLFSIIGEPTNLNICTKSKSCGDVKIIVKGKSCHSSMPENGINANYIVARLMLYIEKLCNKYPETTLTANLVKGGEKVNIISSQAEFSFDMRSYSNGYIESCLKNIKRYINTLKKKYPGCQIELIRNLAMPPMFTRNSELISTICTEFNLKESTFFGGCEAGYFQAVSGDAIIFGVGDLALAHKVNEYVDTSEYDKYCKLLPQVINTIVASLDN